VASFGLGCVEYRGKHYWFWNEPQFYSTSRCQRANSAGRSRFDVVVVDESGAPLPGVAVHISRQKPVTNLRFVTGSDGLVNVVVEPGEWQVEAELKGFGTGRLTQSVRTAETCSLKIYLRLKSTGEVTVT
jgi:hypothetical protein